MSFRDDGEDGRNLVKPFLHTGRWYWMGARQSSMMGSSTVIRESSISVVAWVLIVALGPIQFGITMYGWISLLCQPPFGSISFYVQDFISTSSHLYTIFSIFSVVGVVAMGVTFSLGIGPIPWVIMFEILPINIKGLTGSIATLCNWLFSSLITMTANFLLYWSGVGTFTIYMLIAAFTVAFVVNWVPETKGRALEEIQMSFRRLVLKALIDPPQHSPSGKTCV